MSDNAAKKSVYVHSIKVGCDLLYECGAPGEFYPEMPFDLDVTYKDFDNKEDYITLVRILTQVCVKKISNEKKD